ncbi:hypothetical protein DICPUDRAFT_149098 [Dictyostelium purpureum]|uniref:acylaminoacyl-peptidase n=1 Tax=Dictyostelium purpureum TaxID=5786 RepID=F0ZCU5_DICPU|nr:uncharacterized protein DICPUDRAFT_149098 [Dictyostelium purpureum]EGC38200.1 hypothetical protein DICPUDRAFT_149098 [Dictyostelium purpureum]|eukprot:XP_003285238.1 hypothetical protein DICPUDRAFT_149098 [Dictyostelium purpureum]
MCDKKNIQYFKDIISIPTIVNSSFTNININSNNISISITLSQTDIKNKKNKLYNLDKVILENDSIWSTPFLKEASTLLNSVSPSFRKQITIKETTPNEYIFDILDNDQTIISSFKSNNQIKRILIDDWFGNLSWSPSEDYIVFVGELNKNNNNLGFFNKDSGIDLNNTSIGDQYLYRESWGETYSNVYNPTLFIIDIKNETVFPLETFPNDKITPGQPIWTPCGCGIIFVGWEIDKRKFGLRLCFNRKSSLYHIDFNLYKNNKNQLIKENQQQQQQQQKEQQSSLIITPSPLIIENLIKELGSYRSPRFSPDGNNLVFLGFDEVIYNHNSCSKIFRIPWDKRVEQKKTIVETLFIYRNFNDEFPGIYCSSLPLSPFINNNTIVFSDSVRSIRKLLSFNIDTKQIHIINTNGIIDSKETPCNYFVYQVNSLKKIALCRISSPNQPPSINVLKFNEEGLEITKHLVVYKPKQSDQHANMFSSFKYSIHNVPTLLNAQSLKSFEMIYLKNTSKGKKPTIIFIHGGFQMSVDLEYSFSFAYLVSLGYNIIIPNYRGSTGFGRDFLNSLVGQISQMDVDDCIQALSYSCEKVDPEGIDPDKLCAIGGSHGGSIGAILAALPGFANIKTVILRNPVIDQAAQAMVTDIPDWSMFKCGISIDENKKSYNTAPTIKEIEIMKNLSPIKYIQDINIPVLLLLGENDLRVPPKTQGLLLYNSLKERDQIVKCLMYPSNGHALESIEAKLDQWINISNWLNKYL